MNMLSNPYAPQGRTAEERVANASLLKVVRSTLATCRSRWESNMRNAAYHRAQGNLKVARSHVCQATFWRLQIEMSVRSERPLSAPDTSNAPHLAPTKPLATVESRVRTFIPSRAHVPYGERKRGGVVRAAAQLAADDAADRLLTIVYAARDHNYFDDKYTHEKWEEKVEDVAAELCDFALLAEESTSNLLAEASRKYRNDPEYASVIAETVSILGKISSQQRAA